MAVHKMKSTTPIVEYIDMLYTRLAIEMPKHVLVRKWWVELHPPESAEDGTGYVQIKALKKAVPNKLSGTKLHVYHANMMAVQQGATVGTEALETVVEHHIKRFTEGMFT